MNLKLEPDQLRKILELAYMGEWMINAHHDTEAQDEPAALALQRLMSQASFPDIGRDDETGEYYMDTTWVEKLYDAYILDYDDHVFWDELTERLAQRDLARDRGISPDDIIRDDDLLDLRPLEDRYRSELEERGIDRLEIRADY